MKNIIYYKLTLSFFICLIASSKSFGLNITLANSTIETLNVISDIFVVNFAPGNYHMNDAMINAFG